MAPTAAPDRSLSPASSSTSRRTPQPVVAPKKGSAPPPKPQNLFKNDGSFLSKFKKQLSPEEQEKQDREAAIARITDTLDRPHRNLKKALDERIKNRGKRPLPAAADAANPSSKKPKADDAEQTAYQAEVKRLSARELSDDRLVKPLLK
ncbi:uncharacterized protein RHOBADRAFT_41640 [Rhodotorula graminis WP1]|uniref:Uncharacterized protein n=1 Tax=Rhodotorula graminis (strain WP1) TaxID=578459 RepID=A0A194SB12_RHOGW|nr:uncharacterized protein RHOBADRAFT_41640 [Rhodotorula graminis WP1]KPV77645.1 hypothetical protein RHOBADRAFT_41640 [Rhodotorula graminis WP1]